MLKFLKRAFMILIMVVAAFILAAFIFMQQPQFGKTPDGARAQRIRSSPNFRDGAFHNQSETPNFTNGANFFTVLKDFFFGKSKRSEPDNAIPGKKTNLHVLPADQDVIVWFGHSSYFMQLSGRRFLVDPVFSGSASPLSFTTRSFQGTDLYSVNDIPNIDYLLITHDHWDHLDYETMQKLRSRVGKVVTGLGTGAHLEHWGFRPDLIIEEDWGAEVSLGGGFTVEVAAARHFSGRTFKRNQALWVSFVVDTPTRRVYVGGDSGYDDHFKKLGDKYGSFDLAILECGQYNENWANIHMMPEEVVQAVIDLRAKRLMPVHWSKFALALHDWDEPIIRVVRESRKQNIPVVHPLIGDVVDLNDSSSFDEWWTGQQIVRD